MVAIYLGVVLFFIRIIRRSSTELRLFLFNTTDEVCPQYQEMYNKGENDTMKGVVLDEGHRNRTIWRCQRIANH